MSEIIIRDMPKDSMLRIANARVYDLEESIAASKYPMQTEPDPSKTELTETAVKLAQCKPGTGHDNWLCGVLVSFDISMSAKMMVEWERYSFQSPVSSNSTMHRIMKFDIDSTYCKYVDPRILAVMKELVCKYNDEKDDEKDDDKAHEDYLRVLYSNPAGFTYRLRVTTNYRQIKTMRLQRRSHLLPEWQEFCDWSEQYLPHSELIMGAV